MNSPYVTRNRRGPATKPKSANHLPAAAYDQLVLFVQNYLDRRGDAPKPASNPGEKQAEILQIIFQITKGDVRVRIGVLADKLGIKPRRLSTLFQRLYGTNPKEYQLNIRIGWVCSAISEDPARKIESIAAEVGYTDLSDFNHIFRKHIGVSPQTYQRRANVALKTKTF